MRAAQGVGKPLQSDAFSCVQRRELESRYKVMRFRSQTLSGRFFIIVYPYTYFNSFLVDLMFCFFFKVVSSFVLHRKVNYSARNSFRQALD